MRQIVKKCYVINLTFNYSKNYIITHPQPTTIHNYDKKTRKKLHLKLPFNAAIVKLENSKRNFFMLKWGVLLRIITNTREKNYNESY